MNEIVKESLLFDFYGSLLTEKKRRVMEMYHEENYSLSEIAEETGVSRNAVYDSLKKAEKQLADYEAKLGLVGKLLVTDEKVGEIRKITQGLLQGIHQDDSKKQELEKILHLLDEIDME